MLRKKMLPKSSSKNKPSLTTKKANRQFDLAVQAKLAGKNEEAIDFYREAIAIKPDFTIAYVNLGVLLAGNGQLAAAIASYQQAIHLDPNQVEAHNNFGILNKRLGRWAEAVTSFRQAIQLRPGLAILHYNLANALKNAGSCNEALASYRNAITLAPNEPLFWQEFSLSLAGISTNLLDPGLMQDLQHCLAIEGINKDGLAPASCHLLRHSPKLMELITLSAQGDQEELLTRITSGEIITTISHPLLINLLKSVRLHSVEIERLISDVRRLILFSALFNRLNKETKEALFYFLSALALQCYLNEFIYFQTEEEELWLNTYRNHVEEHQLLEARVVEFDLALLATYAPLNQLGSHQKLIEALPPRQLKGCQDLIVAHLDNPKREASIMAKIPLLTPIRDKTSQLVQHQYEENPYPRWLEAKFIQPSGGLRAQIFSMFPHLPEVNFSNPLYPEILIAGCGTGKQAIECARCFPNGRILAIDLSRASLAYAIRKAEELGINNIEFQQADLLELDQVQQEFDLVSSVGVLHHLAAPRQGWQILWRRIKAGGYMQIGLYSETARQGLNLIRAGIKARNFAPTTATIRQFRQSLIRQEGVLLEQLNKLVDFHSTSECRDLLFHVQEHQFTLPNIKKILADLNLIFLGFEIPPAVTTLFQARFPNQENLTDLLKWHQFEEEHPDSFLAMYQFWLHKPEFRHQ